MNKKIYAALGVLLMCGIFAMPAFSQELTNDVAIVRVGWIPTYTVGYEDSSEDGEFTGFAVMGEYNINVSPLLIAFGVEYQRVVDNADDESDVDAVGGFLIPQAAVKFLAPGGFYIGAGIAGKYLINYDLEGGKTDKTIDLWVNGMIGFITMISDGIYLDIMGRFGYNLTNQTWNKISGMEMNVESAYDIALYVGVGFKTFQTGL